MIGRLNHVAIATRNIKAAAKVYRDTLGAKVSEPVPQPDHGVTTVFVELPNTKIELLEPLGENSPIAKFLEKNPGGGMHHVCYEVEDIYAARDQMRREGATIVTFTRTCAPALTCHVPSASRVTSDGWSTASYVRSTVKPCSIGASLRFVGAWDRPSR